jgi:hypothetical protein
MITDENGKQKEIFYFPGDPQAFINNLVPIFHDKYGIAASQAGFTINYIILYVLNGKKTSGGLKMDATKIKAARAAKAASPKVAPTTISGSTEFEIHKDVQLADKKLKQLVYSLFDEPVAAREWLAEIKLKKEQFNSEHEDDRITDLAPDIFANLVQAGILKPTKAAQAEKEGEGSGEIETIEDYPEGDDTYTAAKKEFGFKPAIFDRFDS